MGRTRSPAGWGVLHCGSRGSSVHRGFSLGIPHARRPDHALLAVGVVGLYFWQRRQQPFEWLGTVGVILIVTPSVLITLGGLVLIFVDGVLGTEAEVLNDIVHPLELVVMMGAVLFGMATMRVNVLPSGGA